MFFRLFEHTEQRSFVPPIMRIKCNFTCSNKKLNSYKNYFLKICRLSVVHPASKTEKQKFIYLFIAPPNSKHCGTAQERWMKPDTTLSAFNVKMPPLLFSCQSCICWQARYILSSGNSLHMCDWRLRRSILLPII